MTELKARLSTAADSGIHVNGVHPHSSNGFFPTRPAAPGADFVATGPAGER
ncbi:hypothetical protein ABGB12_01170 [Actinocorallia sp. B10E7]|uniref:hypothetical protein n=1 Tax=Actinocorallia sp. B10E7 TaxID=3153558 RepID=UPI00325D8FAE